MQEKTVPTSDEIWKILKEVSLSQKETDRKMQETDRKMQETDRLLRESKQETDRKMQETDRLLRESKQETDRKMQETDRLLRESKQETDRKIQENDRLIKTIEGRFGNQWGELIEALIEGSLIQILNEKGIKVNRVVANYKGSFKGRKKEFDVLALNGNELVVIETKSQLNQKKVDEFLEIMGVFKEYCPEYASLKVYGGMACLKGKESVFLYAEKRGLFVIRVSGKNAVLMNQEKFKPKALA